VLIKSSYWQNEIKFSIEDTGVGMEKEKFAEVITKWPGIGLKNVNERLKLLYDEKHGLDIITELDCGTKVSFLIPREV
jgi:two-component system LytT family sensor kinase